MKPKHLIITLLALFASITASAYTWTDANGTEWYFTTFGSNAKITNRGYSSPSYLPSISGTIPADLTIPTTLYVGETPYTVTSIGDYAFSGCSSLTSVNIPEGVTSIGNSAFYGCSSLTSITIPNGVTSIEDGAFSGCSSLFSIIIPNSVTSISVSAFRDCRGLTSIMVTAGNEKYDSRNNSNAIIETATNTLIIGCKNTIIPNSVTDIGGQAFYGCSSLTSISIPDGVTSIRDHAFSGCVSLSSITIPSSVSSIGETAFGYHNMIVTFDATTPCTQSGMGNAVKLVVPHAGIDAYREAWASLADVIVDAQHIEETVDVTANESSSAVAEAIGEDLLKNVLRLKVKGTFNSYDVMVFRNKMINLMDLDLSDANVVASSYAYFETYKTKDNVVTGYFIPTRITNIVLPKDIIALEPECFIRCENLQTIDLPDGIPSIPSYSFYGCNKLKSIEIPESVTSIEYYLYS